MKLSILTAHGWLSMQPDGRLEFRKDVGAWETFDFVSFDPVPPPVPPAPPAEWPPIVPPWPPQPANIATTDVELVRERVRWWLWSENSSDDESYWMDVILLKPESGHTPGWTADSYWPDKIKAGDGVGEGYVWPAR